MFVCVCVECSNQKQTEKKNYPQRSDKQTKEIGKKIFFSLFGKLS